ncbi:MAG: sigma-70 family RNA polymerase sigma factor [Anaerolineales bacterium]|jgi:RNA polymerase sigma-70 factor (ECF subfamily)|nr:sigma-70 family RNA polymerase sigma factor [Anaerolineales bacterium]
MEEQEAIRLLKQGDLAGLNPLVERYYFQAVKAAYLIVQEPGQAEDIVQDAFIQASQKIHQLASDVFGPWFLRIVINASIRSAREASRQVSLQGEVGNHGQTFEDLLFDCLPGPEVVVENEEFTTRVWQALQQLPADQRAAVVLKYYLEMSEVEVAAELGHRVATIKGRLYAARQRLKRLLVSSQITSSDASRQPPFSSNNKKRS